jgi:ParB family chromosome partitioning protein
MRTLNREQSATTKATEPVAEVLEIPIDRILIGERIRRDPGDLDGLAASLQARGQLVPILVMPLNRDGCYPLVAGERRIKAAERRGWPTIKAIIATDLDTAEAAFLAEGEENTQRKDFSPVEARRWQARREEILAPLAKERQREGLKRATAQAQKRRSDRGPTKVPRSTESSEKQPRRRLARSHETAAQGTGWSPESLRKVKKVEEIAEDPAIPDEVREMARRGLEEMHATRTVDPTYKRVMTTVDSTMPRPSTQARSSSRQEPTDENEEIEKMMPPLRPPSVLNGSQADTVNKIMDGGLRWRDTVEMQVRTGYLEGVVFPARLHTDLRNLRDFAGLVDIDAARDACIADDNVLDAVVAAYVTWLAQERLTVSQSDEDHRFALVEGWIHLPSNSD